MGSPVADPRLSNPKRITAFAAAISVWCASAFPLGCIVGPKQDDPAPALGAADASAAGDDATSLNGGSETAPAGSGNVDANPTTTSDATLVDSAADSSSSDAWSDAAPAPVDGGTLDGGVDVASVDAGPLETSEAAPADIGGNDAIGD
jgi:hypothetical protein